MPHDELRVPDPLEHPPAIGVELLVITLFVAVSGYLARSRLQR